MLNCKNCGAPLSLEDAVCPYCGTPNEEAKAHIDTLTDISEDFEEAKEEVIKEVSKTKRGYNLLVMIAFLLLANLILLPMHWNDFEIAHAINASSMNIEEVKAQMDIYLANEEYEEFVIFYDKYETDYEKFRDYNPIYYAASNETWILKYVTNFMYQEDNYSDPLMKLCSRIKDYEDEYAYTVKRDYYEGNTKVHLDKINDRISACMKTFLKLTDEDIAAIKDMTETELVVLVKERLGNE